MRTGLTMILLLTGVVGSARAAETRCGWLANLTPQDLWLTDRQATWGITSQGQALGPDAQRVDKVPAFDRRQFVETRKGVGYGYGCACLRVETQAKGARITRVLGGIVRPLARCRADKTLGSPEGA